MSDTGSISERQVSWLGRNAWWLASLLTLSGLGAYFIYLTTQHGIGLRDDSFSYFTAAEGLLSGAGYGRITGEGTFYPLTNFPPVYSILLALTKAAGLELAAGARLIAGLSFAGAIGLAGLSAWVASRSGLTAVLAAGLVLFSPSLLEVFSWAHSEDPYLVLMLAFLLLYSLSGRKGTHTGFKLAGLLAVTVAVLTRYVGVVLLVIPATGLIADASNWRTSRSRWRMAYVGLPALALLTFLARNKVLTGGLTNRPVPSFHLPPAETIIEGGRALLGWVGIHPESVATNVAWISLAVMAVVLLRVGAWSLRRLPQQEWASDKAGGEQPTLAALHGLQAAAYGAFLTVSLLFLDRLTPLDDRILSPLLVSLLVVLSVGLGHAIRTRDGMGRWLVAVLACALLVGQVALGLAALRSLSAEGMGFNSPLWRSSRAIDRIAELPQRPIYTNNVPALYFLSNRQTSFIPARYDPAGDRPQEDYERQLSEMRGRLKEEQGYLIILGWPPESALPPDHLADLSGGLQLLTRTRDGLIYCACVP